MDNFNKRLRESHDTPLNVSPPTQQWGKIRAGRTSQPKAANLNRFFPGMVVGQLMAMAVWWAWPTLGNGPISAVPAVAPVNSPAPVTQRLPDTVYLRDTVYLHDTVYLDRYVARPPAPSRSTTSVAEVPFHGIAGVRSGFSPAAPPDFGYAAYLSSGHRKLASPTVPYPSVLAQKFTSSPVLSDTVAINPLLVKQTYTALARLRDTIIRPTDDQSAASKERLNRTTRPPGRWEFGAHFTPHIDGRTYIVDRYSAEPASIRPAETFEVDGGNRELYYQGTENIDGRNVFRPILISHLEAGRQFASGFRLGLGFSVYNQPRFAPNNDQLLPRLFEGEYYVYSRGDSEELSLTLSAGYTFRKRKRLQYHLGAMVQGVHSNHRDRTTFLYSRDDRRSYTQGYIGGVTRKYFINYRILPQLDIQYHLNKRFSFGLEVSPGIGVGGRLKL